MILSSLSLQNFRNFKKKKLEFSPAITIIVAPNTFGKTNILEAIYLLATGKSFRADLEKEVIMYGGEIGRITGVVLNERLITQKTQNITESTELEVLVTTGQVGGKKAPKKKFLVNGVSKRSTNFIGNFLAVLFSPQDLQLITDSPSLRRKYLSTVLSSVDKQYRTALLIYEKALRQRNKVLERIREKQVSLSQLDYWDKLLIDNGQIITKKREEFIDFINQQDFAEKNINDFKIIYEKNEISEKKLVERREKEIVLGVTLVGPHRDDIKFNIKYQISNIKNEEKDLSIFGSRGEQRLAVLWLKLGELAFLEEKTSHKPVLLLDDIFSELDADHRDLVTKIIPNQQTIITTTEKGVVKGKFLKEAKTIKLEI